MPTVKLPNWIANEIRARFRGRQPLNLSAVKRTAPELIEGLFDPSEFIGWRSALLACGIDPDETVTELEETVPCLLCEFEGQTLMSHLRRAHEFEAGEYRREFPEADLVSEAFLAHRCKLRARRTGRELPHWEACWSPEYALDRLHHYRLRGDSVHFRNVIKLDSKLLMYVWRAFPSYDAALERIGLVPAEVHVMEHRQWSRENILRTLKQREMDGGSFGIAAMKRDFAGLIRASTALFGSYENALLAVNLDPRKLVIRKPKVKGRADRGMKEEAVRLAESS